MTRTAARILVPVIICASTACSDRIAGAPRGNTVVDGCFQFDRAYFHWVGRRPGNDRISVDSAAVLQFSTGQHLPHPLRREGTHPVLPLPIVTDSTTRARWLGPSHWRSDGEGAVVVVWRNGLYGPVFELRVRGDTLAGSVRQTTDSGEPVGDLLRELFPGRARAIRVPCPSS
jgi:hypothetical protein